MLRDSSNLSHKEFHFFPRSSQGIINQEKCDEQNALHFKYFFLQIRTTVAATNNNAPKTQMINVAGGSTLTSTVRPVTSVTQQNLTRTVGNNKTCNWVFENGEVCGKTFAKSYNLVVHMRMHEDVRPFGCSFCDQTFRYVCVIQKGTFILLVSLLGKEPTCNFFHFYSCKKKFISLGHQTKRHVVEKKIRVPYPKEIYNKGTRISFG